MCGGFKCLRNALIALNILYIVSKQFSYFFFTKYFTVWNSNCLFFLRQVLGIILIYVSVNGQFTFSYSGNLNAANWIENCGFLLICLAVMGLVAAVKHHQISLFFVSFCAIFKHLQLVFNTDYLFFLMPYLQYMFILAAIILVQIFVSIACIATKDSQLKSLASDVSFVSSSILRIIEKWFCILIFEFQNRVGHVWILKQNIVLCSIMDAVHSTKRYPLKWQISIDIAPL